MSEWDDMQEALEYQPKDKGVAEALNAVERMAAAADYAVSRIVGWDGETSAYHLMLAAQHLRIALFRAERQTPAQPLPVCGTCGQVGGGHLPYCTWPLPINP